MSEASTPGGDVTRLLSSKTPLFWTVTGFGAATGLFAALVAMQVSLVVLDRHFSLAGVFWQVRHYVENTIDTAAFAIVYLVVPVAWAALAVRWWATRPSPRRRVWHPALGVFAIAGLFSVWGWFVTAVRHIKWVFDVEAIPHGLGTFGISDADRLEPLIVTGLGCLVGLVVANSALMLFEAAKR